jgi:dGTP triphosphohydrolase
MTLTDLPADFDFLRETQLQKSPSLSHNSDVETSANLHEKSTIIVEEDLEDLSAEKAQIISSEVQISDLIPETNENSDNSPQNKLLEVEDNHKAKSIDFLANYTSRLLWEQLFAQSLKHDVDQINLKIGRDLGSIECMANQQVISSLKQVAPSSYFSLVEEIKALVKLSSSVALKSIKKVAIERFHQKGRIILRLAFIPNQYGLDITIDILRNEVLQDYEQKQMDKMSQQALSQAQKLEKLLKTMKSCFPSAKVTNLKELQTIQREIDSYLNLLNR